jgi:site-specific DNA-methyltransferase (adenine-specific)
MNQPFESPRNMIVNADCIEVMRAFEDNRVDFILTDPPYVTRYRDREGRTVANDDNGQWLHPAFEQMRRVLKDGRFCVTLYGWNRIDLFMDAWRAAGFRIVGHLVFRKRYASSSRFLRYEHEQAYLLAKGNPSCPANPIPDVLDFRYTGNRLHPTQKPVEALMPLIDAFTARGEVVLDPFAGSGSTLAAAQHLEHDWLGIELDNRHYHTASRRLAQDVTRGRAL